MENPTRVSRLVVYALIGVAAIAVIWSLNLKSEPQEYLSISELAQLIKENKVSELIVSGDGRNVTVEYSDANLAETQSQISDVSSLEEGMYIIRLMQKKLQVETFKVLKYKPWINNFVI